MEEARTSEDDQITTHTLSLANLNADSDKISSLPSSVKGPMMLLLDIGQRVFGIIH